MYRLVSFIVIFGFVAIMLHFHNENKHDIASHLNSHQIVNIPASQPIPSITGEVIQDKTGTWLLKLETTNFTFTPEKVGTLPTKYNEGHAHLYINGAKINRVYGHYYNIDYLKPGTHHIKVTLNSNNHSIYTYNGKEIAFNQTIEVQ